MTLIHSTEPVSLVGCDVCGRVVLANHYGEPLPAGWLQGPYAGGFLHACPECEESTMEHNYGYVRDGDGAAINYPSPIPAPGEWSHDDWRLADIAERVERRGRWAPDASEYISDDPELDTSRDW